MTDIGTKVLNYYLDRTARNQEPLRDADVHTVKAPFPMFGGWYGENLDGLQVAWDPYRGGRVTAENKTPSLQRVPEFRRVDGTGRVPAEGGRRSCSLYRSGALEHATYSDQLALRHLLHGGTVLDLRTENRLRGNPDPHLEGVARSEILLPPTVYVPYADIVSKPQYRETLRRLLRLIADPQTGTVLVHCTEGKDRTGIVVALVQLALGHSVSRVEPPLGVCRPRRYMACDQ